MIIIIKDGPRMGRGKDSHTRPKDKNVKDKK
jgi:hypothetical protein